MVYSKLMTSYKQQKKEIKEDNHIWERVAPFTKQFVFQEEQGSTNSPGYIQILSLSDVLMLMEALTVTDKGYEVS